MGTETDDECALAMVCVLSGELAPESGVLPPVSPKAKRAIIAASAQKNRHHQQKVDSTLAMRTAVASRSGENKRRARAKCSSEGEGIRSRGNVSKTI